MYMPAAFGLIVGSKVGSSQKLVQSSQHVTTSMDSLQALLSSNGEVTIEDIEFGVAFVLKFQMNMAQNLFRKWRRWI